jgi:hypothetical protein
MVALHKEHYVFPMTLAVTRVSGTGAEAMFMGVMRPAVEDAGAVKAWIMPGEWLVSRFLDVKAWIVPGRQGFAVVSDS